ncbi:hypothetical protein [Solidesulfovibrio magneticus]|uniref:Uncharacterized protein n=1 Tax=Solidesulfovibrio magneticus (strain ATCC 700980 / DSM 13731 / RS-1) TaxID=573370 RepID=C4XM25_SOLM1|nr:hypothetical protein [Solidesulfovibrio magneticus]BAH77153.1 hypothetical protein DMR_36620 [Solidesulfovibrio magneticus RS-1]
MERLIKTEANYDDALAVIDSLMGAEPGTMVSLAQVICSGWKPMLLLWIGLTPWSLGA